MGKDGSPGVNDPAPDFTLNTHNEGELNLAWYRGRKHVVLAFYPGDWTPVCATQVPEYQKELSRFEESDCQLLCISVDSVPCHRAWAKSLGGLDYPLMADYFQHGEVAEKYGVLSKKGFANRAVFLIDKKGIIRFVEHVDLMKLPDNEILFKKLNELHKEFPPIEN